MSNFLQIATDLVNRGFSVIPIEPRGKRPVFKLGGVTNRTRDLKVVQVWSEVEPDANVAICADEDTVILETDDYGQLEALMINGAAHTMPTTLTACGSSENRPHLFFKRTEKATNVGNLVVPGLFEARFNNQYVVGPGSTHPSGAQYRWLNSVDIVSIPDWLVSELARLATSQKASGTSSQRAIELVAGRVPEGSRHYFLMQQLGRLWDGRIAEEELIEKAFELNGQCDPPKDAAHVRQCVRDIMRREPYDPGPTVVIGSQTEEKKTSPSDEWVSLSASELVALEIPARNPILTENGNVLFYQGSINQILAWRGVGKTCFALGLAGALATGGQILDFRADGARRVLYIDGELPKKQLQERVQSLVPDTHRDFIQLFGPEFLPSPRGLNLLSNGDFNSLLRLVEKNGTEVLFIDSQSTTMAGDSNKTEFQEARQNVLMQLRWMGLTVIEMHHVGKSGQQRGISRNDDILDVQIHLKEMADWEPEDGLQFQIVYKKVRHAAKLETGYTVTLENGQWAKRPADEVSIAADLYNAGKTQREVAKELKCSLGKANHLHRSAIRLKLVEPAIDVQIGETRARARKGV